MIHFVNSKYDRLAGRKKRDHTFANKVDRLQPSPDSVFNQTSVPRKLQLQSSSNLSLFLISASLMDQYLLYILFSYTFVPLKQKTSASQNPQSPQTSVNSRPQTLYPQISALFQPQCISNLYGVTKSHCDPHTHTHTHIHTHTYTHTQTHRHTHTYTDTHTQTHTHSQPHRH